MGVGCFMKGISQHQLAASLVCVAGFSVPALPVPVTNPSCQQGQDAKIPSQNLPDPWLLKPYEIRDVFNGLLYFVVNGFQKSL